MNAKLPVTIVTGFLGAGKTTLVNQWLSRVQRGDVAVIVNEYGDVGIDGALLAKRAQMLIEVTGGCVCCTTQNELIRALDTIATTGTPPKRVLIETSGAASPAGVIRAVLAGGRSDAFTLDGVVTAFDTTRIASVFEHDLAREQLGYADVVVLTRASLCTSETMAQTRAFLARENGAAAFVEYSQGEAVDSELSSLEAVLSLRRTLFITPLPSTVPTAQHVYQSISCTLEGEVDGERFGDFVESQLAPVSGRIFRVKGILAVAGVSRRMIVQGVADCIDVTFGDDWGDEPRTSRLVIVGYGLEHDELVHAFEQCREGP